MDEMNYQYKNIYISEDKISGKTTIDVMKAVTSAVMNKKKINFIIDCSGGSSMQGIALYGILSKLPVEHRTIGVGLVASSAALVLQGASKGERYLVENTSFFVHAGNWSLEDDYSNDELRTLVKDQEHWDEVVMKIYQEKTGDPEVGRWFRGDNYLTPEQAVENGFADHVIMQDKLIEFLVE